MKKRILILLVISIFIMQNNKPVIAQINTTSSSDNAEQLLCNMLAKSASSQIETRIQADNISIPQPQSIFNLSCLNSFFSGIGMNIFSNVINPENIIKQITNKICTAVDQTWQSATGSGVQCGLTLSIPDIGFNGINLGSGKLCNNVNIGHGNQIGSVNMTGSVNNSSQTNPTLPTGYSAGD